MLVTVDDVPLPEAPDRVDEDGTLRLHLQSVGSHEDGPSLFPDFTFGSWWHIGLHDFDTFAAAMATRAAAPPLFPQLFWIGNLEMSASRAHFATLADAHQSRIRAVGITWQHARGNVTEATGERAAR